MTLTAKSIAIFGMIQVGVITYTVLAVNTLLKLRGENFPPTELVAAFRSFGIVLYVLPLLRCCMAAYFLSKTEPSPNAGLVSAVAWVTITAFLLIVAVFFTIRALGIQET